MKTLLIALLLVPLIIWGNGPISTPTPSPQSPTPALTLDQRVQAQTANEKIFYEKRIWPKENKAPKPAFEQMAPKELIEKKVNESLLKSAAMEKYWNYSITPQMLQAELERMAKGTQDAQTLHDLFEALGNDPRLIAETLARETLSDRLARSWYDWDTRFHAPARARAEAIAHDLAPRATRGGRGRREAPGEGSPLPPGTESHRHTYLLDERGEKTPPMPGMELDTTRVKAEEFSALKKKYSGRDGTADSARSPFAPVGAGLRPAQNSAERREYSGNSDIGIFRAGLRPAPTPDYTGRAMNESMIHPLETAEGFVLQRTLSVTDNRIEIETIIIRKTTFDEWWGKASVQARASSIEHRASNDFSFRLPAIAAVAGCDQWTSPTGLNNILPTPRRFHTAVWTGTELIVWGGEDSGFNSLNTGGRYNPATDTWAPTSVGANLPSPRAYHTAVWSGTEMVVWGGNFGGQLNSGGRYNPLTNKWAPTSTGANVPDPRDYHAAVWTGGEMIVWGGYTNTVGITSSGGRYNPASDSWQPTSTGAGVPSPREPGSAVWTGTEMIIWGGVGGGFSYLNSGGRYHPGSDSWQPTSTGANLPPGRMGNTSVWTGNEMIVWGGYTCPGGIPSCTWTNTNTGGRYNPASDSWQPTSTGVSALAPRDLHAAAWTGGEMIVWGGRQCTSGPLCNSLINYNDGGRYNPVTDSWTLTPTGTGVPAPRLNATAVWSGSEMIVWGGWQCNGSPCPAIYFNSGGRYNPAADSWVPTSMGGNVPAGRETHTAVWTGSDMIVWGGNTFNGIYFNNGGRYNMATDNWTTTSVVNSPEGRGSHSVIWTGNTMIVWGGTNGVSTLNTGGQFNPISDSWAPTSIDPNVPNPIRNHAVVWTGTEMIIWGGGSNGNKGGRYNPVSDSWTLTSTGANVPSERGSHTAVWTGKEMIIWGGYKSGPGYLNTGSRYDPITDSWATASAGTNIPSPRVGHSAKWTGDEMIIWAGSGGAGSFLNTGGRYNPVLDRWIMTPTGINNPTPRYFHTTAWIGSEMIVWGGYEGTVYGMDSGGRYNTDADAWQPTSAGNNSPDRRYNHTVVGIGAGMIVWGGQTEINPNTAVVDEFLNAGGLYSSGSASSPGTSLRANKSSFINLNWSSVFGAGSYNVKRCNPTATGCIPGTTVSTPTINQYSEPDDGLSHFYAVEAVNQCGATP